MKNERMRQRKNSLKKKALRLVAALARDDFFSNI